MILLMQIIIAWGIFRNGRERGEPKLGKSSKIVPSQGQNLRDALRSRTVDPFAAMDSMMSSALRDMVRLHSAMQFDDNWDSIRLSPTMDMRSDDSDYIVMMSIPGIESTNLDVSLNGRVLTVRASSPGRMTPYHQQFRQFEKRILLPGKIGDISHARADVTNGLLRVHVPRGDSSGHQHGRINLF